MNMIYETNCENLAPKTCVNAERLETLSEEMRNVSDISRKILIVTANIKAHMFGIYKPDDKEVTDPKCFRDELMMTKCDLMNSLNELEEICRMLGM